MKFHVIAFQGLASIVVEGIVQSVVQILGHLLKAWKLVLIIQDLKTFVIDWCLIEVWIYLLVGQVFVDAESHLLAFAKIH